MNTWEQCKNYGLVKIVDHYENKFIYLHHGPNSNDRVAVRGQDIIQHNMIVENAMWQGNNLIITGRNKLRGYDGERMTAIVNDFAVIKWV